MRDHVNALTLAIACATISPSASLVFAAVWLLPNWVRQWLDVRDRWHR